MQDILSKASDTLGRIKRYLPILFIALLAVVYGYLIYRVGVLNTQEPAGGTDSNSAQILHVDQNAINQVKSLQDNSVNVQTLFSGARNNPFNE